MAETLRAGTQKTQDAGSAQMFSVHARPQRLGVAECRVHEREALVCPSPASKVMMLQSGNNSHFIKTGWVHIADKVHHLEHAEAIGRQRASLRTPSVYNQKGCNRAKKNAR